MMHPMTILALAGASGLTMSGIVATLFRLFATTTSEDNPMIYYPVIALAGPSVLMENVAQSLRIGREDVAECALAAACSVFWSSMIGAALLVACGFH
jgi:hypothetical protein